MTQVEFDLDALYVAVDRHRRARRLSWQQVSAETDLAPYLTYPTELEKR